MRRWPTVLISPDIEDRGREFQDLSISLSANYQQALIAVGALPLSMPATISRHVIAECVRQSQGVVLTGGDDLAPELYAERLSKQVRRSVETTPDGGQRDLRELLLIDEVFRQHKPLLAICRGQQILNVALGGTLVADIPRQVPRALNHRRLDRCSQVVHEVRLTPGCVLAKITGSQWLGVNSTHHQAVAQVAPLLRVAGRSPDGVIEALELRPGAAQALPWLLSVQFHPERLVERHPAHQAIFRAFTRACSLNHHN